MCEAATAMTEWQSHKKVFANKITDLKQVDASGKGRIFLDNGGFVEVEHSWLAKHLPEVGGYYVRYKDGYESYSPAKAFEEGYTKV